MSGAPPTGHADDRDLAIAVPDALAARYAAWSWTLVYCTDDTRTWRIEDGSTTRFVKVVRTAAYPTLAATAARLRWAGQWLPVPAVVDVGRDDCGEWLVTTALAGRDLTRQDPSVEPRRLVEHFAHALRQFHDRAPVGACPFEFTVDVAIAHVRARIDAGLVDPDRDFQPEHRHLSAHGALAELERLRPDREDLVVCHGDYCPPNVIVAADEVNGYVDLGELGVSDRWRDVAMGTWSTTWNFGAGYEDLFLAVYGAEPDDQRGAFYRLLHEVVS